MNILAVETSSALLSVASQRQGKKVVESDLDGGREHAEKLLVLIERVLKKSGLAKSKLDFLACGVGPGSFTGLRIGLAAVKGIAIGLGKKIIPVSSLDIIAEGAPISDGQLAVILDARRGMVYSAFYEFKNGIPKKTFGDSLISFGQLMKQISPKTIFSGDALRMYGSQIRERFGKKNQFLKEKFWKPRAAFIIKWISRHPKIKFVSSAELKPAYLRLSEAEERRKGIA